MKTLEAPFVALPLITVLLISCSDISNDSKEKLYSSRERAESACKSWKVKGGSWELKVNDFVFFIMKECF